MRNPWLDVAGGLCALREQPTMVLLRLNQRADEHRRETNHETEIDRQNRVARCRDCDWHAE